MRKYRIIGSLLLLAVMCVACNPDSGKKKISIAYWLEGIAMSHLAKVVLEEKGYEVELLNADVAPVFASVSRKKADVFMDAWLPVTMKDYIDQYGDQIEFIGEVYDSARAGGTSICHYRFDWGTCRPQRAVLFRDCRDRCRSRYYENYR